MTPPPAAAQPPPARESAARRSTRRARSSTRCPRARASRSCCGCSSSCPFLALLAAVPVAWGWGLSWLDVALDGGLLRGHRARHHRRLPPLLHPRLVQGQPAAEDRPGAWPGRWRSRARSIQLGGRPPPAPRVLRPRGRPALAVAVRRDRRAALTKGLCYAHIGWLFDASRPTRSSYAPDLLADRDIGRVSRLFPALVVALAAAARRSSAACSPGPGRAR